MIRAAEAPAPGARSWSHHRATSHHSSYLPLVCNRVAGTGSRGHSKSRRDPAPRAFMTAIAASEPTGAKCGGPAAACVVLDMTDRRRPRVGDHGIRQATPRGRAVELHLELRSRPVALPVLRTLAGGAARAPVDQPVAAEADALRIDEPLKATAKPGVRRPDQRLRIVAAPAGQAADPAPSLCIAHAPEDRPTASGQSSREPTGKL